MKTIIGTKNCGRCRLVKSFYEKKQLPFEYVLFEELSLEKQEFWQKLAAEKNIQSFPLVINEDGEIITE